MFSSLKAAGLPRLWSLLDTSATRAFAWKRPSRRNHVVVQQRPKPHGRCGLTGAAAQRVGSSLPSTATGIVLSSQANYYRVRLDEPGIGEASVSGVRSALYCPFIHAAYPTHQKVTPHVLACTFKCMV